MHDFFLYYSNFPFVDEVVCPLAGRPVPRRSLRYGLHLPAALARCAIGGGAGKRKKMRNLGKPLAIQEPFEVDRNVGKRLSLERLEHLVEVFGRAARLLAGGPLAALLRPEDDWWTSKVTEGPVGRAEEQSERK